MILFKCSIEDCINTNFGGRGWCMMHYTRWRRHGDPLYRKKIGNGERALQSCGVDGCSRSVYGHNLCGMHYQRARRIGTFGPVDSFHRADGTGSFNQGYLIVQENKEKMRVHRKLAEKALGKPLPEGAIVHHFNRNRADNSPTNLVVCPNEEYHKLLHKRARELGYYLDEPPQTENGWEKRSRLFWENFLNSSRPPLAEKTKSKQL